MCAFLIIILIKQHPNFHFKKPSKIQMQLHKHIMLHSSSDAVCRAAWHNTTSVRKQEHAEDSCSALK